MPKFFSHNHVTRLKERVQDLHEEASAQAEYGREMAKLVKILPKKTHKMKQEDSSPSRKTVADVFEKHPELNINNSLIKQILRAI